MILQFQPWDDLVARVGELLSGAGAGRSASCSRSRWPWWVVGGRGGAARGAPLCAPRASRRRARLIGEGGGLPMHEPPAWPPGCSTGWCSSTAVLFAIDSMGSSWSPP